MSLVVMERGGATCSTVITSTPSCAGGARANPSLSTPTMVQLSPGEVRSITSSSSLFPVKSTTESLPSVSEEPGRDSDRGLLARSTGLKLQNSLFWLNLFSALQKQTLS